MAVKSKVNNTKIAAGITGGITAIINAGSAMFLDLDETQSDWMTQCSPFIGSAIVAVIYFIWECSGIDSERFALERRLKKQAKIAKKQLNDDFLSDKDKEAVQADYASILEALRNIHKP